MDGERGQDEDGVVRDTVFATRDLLVRRVRSGAGAVCFVTFDSYTDRPTLDRPGFGEHFFAARGMDAVHVLSRENRWYQQPELPQALAAIARVTGGYRRVIAYGSSMGGFAALRYGGAFGAQAGVALSPQFSIDPAVVPFERRWLREASRISRWLPPPAPIPWQVIVYDPRDPNDQRHFDLFAAQSPTVAVRVPHGGHPVGSHLAEACAFEPLLQGVAEGAFDAAAYQRLLRDRRHRSGHYHFTLSRRLPARRLAAKIALARTATTIVPYDAAYLSHLATLLDQAGDDRAARAAHERAVTLPSASHHTWYNLVLHHERLGEWAPALDRLQALLNQPSAPRYLRLARRRIRIRQRAETPLGRLTAGLGIAGAVKRAEFGLARAMRILGTTRTSV